VKAPAARSSSIVIAGMMSAAATFRQDSGFSGLTRYLVNHVNPEIL
jgi:hypothetical protein